MQTNQQPPEKLARTDGRTLAVNSIFHTIQGEGPFAGKPAVFVRLAGCNLQCPACDTEYTARVELHVEEIVSWVRGAHAHYPCNLVVITGGEPFRQNITLLVRALLWANYEVQVETNGTMPPSPGLPTTNRNFTIVCSPKAGRVNANLVPHVGAWKYVADAAALRGSLDGLPSNALHHPNRGGLYRPPRHHPGQVYLQPMDSKDAAENAANVQAVVQACLQYGHRLCLQIHKHIGVE